MLNFGRTVRDATAAVVVSMVAIAFYVSCAAMLFPGVLATQLPIAIGLSLLGGTIMAVVAAWKGTIPRASVGPEPATVPVVAGITAAIAMQSPPELAAATAVMAIALSSMLVGLSWFVIGKAKSGDAIRYVPYPVIGGFLAGVGWLLLSGGLSIVIGRPVSLAWLSDVATHAPSALMVSGVIVAGGFWLMAQRSRHFLVLPALIVAFSLGIHAWMRFAGMDLAAARVGGWLMPSFEMELPTFVLGPDALHAVDWAALKHEWSGFVAVVIVSTVALLLSDSSLEVAFDEEADFNRDLKSLGLGNIVLGLCGGLVSGISISRSLLNGEAGAQGRMSGAFKALLCLAAMGFGGPVIALIPKPVLAGILMYMGFGMLKAWLVDARSRLGTSDYLVVASMVVTTIVAGYLPAVFFGVIFCCFDFAFLSAKQGAVRRIANRNAWPGRVERSTAEKQVLAARADEVLVIELQGVLFFGSIRRLSLTVQSLRMSSEQKAKLMLLDFTRVPALDTSAATSLSRIIKKSAAAGIAVQLCGAIDPVARMLAANGCLPSGDRMYVDIDQAIVSWEESVLASRPQPAGDPFEAWLVREFQDPAIVQRLLGHLEIVELESGGYLFRKGESSDSLYWVQSGRLAALHELGGGPRRRLVTFNTGSTVGEMGVFRQMPRSADVVAEEPCVLRRLTHIQIAEIERNDPELAMQLLQLFVRLLATRLELVNTQVVALAA